MEDNFYDNGPEGNSRMEALWREERQKSRQEVLAKLDTTKDQASSGVKIATDKFLKQSILNVFTTFSLSLFYSYAHVFLNAVFPKFFSPLGHEWVPDEIKKSNPELAAKMGKKIGIAEKGLIGCGCFLHTVIIVGFCVIVYYMFNKWDLLVEAVSAWVKGIFE